MTTVADKIRDHFRKNPDADVKKAAAKFNQPVSRIYLLRKQVREAGTEAQGPKRRRRVKRFALTRAQFMIAKKLGIDPKEYARQMAKLEAEMVPEPLPVPELSVWNAQTTKEGDIVATLNARAQEYGKFKDGANLMQSIKRLLADHAAKHGKTFVDDQWEALEMIVHKIARIVNGNPDKVDHWVDIAGYATLVADRLQGVER